MSFKKTLVSLVSVSIGCISFSAIAGALTIYNFTNQDSTTKTNGSVYCSSQVLGSYGITPHKTPSGPGVNTIYDPLLRIACAGNLEACQAIVYMDDHCGTTPVALATFSVTYGLVGQPTILDPAYSMAGSGFVISILGGH